MADTPPPPSPDEPTRDAPDELPEDRVDGAAHDDVARRSPGRVAADLIAVDHPHMEVVDVGASADPVPVDLRDYVVFSPDHATRVRTIAGEQVALDLWCIEPQQSTGVLQYPDHDVVYTVVGGRSWFVTERGDVGLDPLGALLVPAGTVHGIDNRGADPLIVSMAMAPPDDVDVTAPTGPGAAIRDDAQWGATGRRLRGAVERLLGR